MVALHLDYVMAVPFLEVNPQYEYLKCPHPHLLKAVPHPSLEFSYGEQILLLYSLIGPEQT